MLMPMKCCVIVTKILHLAAIFILDHHHLNIPCLAVIFVFTKAYVCEVPFTNILHLVAMFVPSYQ